MSTWNHTTGLFEVNKVFYPYHALLERMKRKADSLIIETYSKEFYENHVQFDFDCYAYHGYWITMGDETFWTSEYVGNWISPMKRKPNCFKFNYQIRLSKTDQEYIELGMDLDSLGNFEPTLDDKWNNYGFEDVKGQKKTFLLDKVKVNDTAIKFGLNISDTTKTYEYLTWENFEKQLFFDGQYRYYIVEETSKTEYKNGRNRKGIIFRYTVYSFNPWTGEFIEKKKMKSISERGKGHGFSTGLLPDEE